MKRCTKCSVEKPLSAFSINPLGRLGVRADCRDCVSAYDAARYARTAERQREKARQRRASDPNRHRGYVKAYYARNAERIKAERRSGYDPIAGAARVKSWRQCFPEKHVAQVVARDAGKLKATPNWASKDEILKFYAEARRLTSETGVLHHVDHIIPLRGKKACGLHCEFNLRVVPAKINQKKYNFMPDEQESTRRAEANIR